MKIWLVNHNVNNFIITYNRTTNFSWKLCGLEAHTLSITETPWQFDTPRLTLAEAQTSLSHRACIFYIVLL
jgi:hypothetical protein